MFRFRNAVGFTQYLLLGVLTLFSECQAAFPKEQNDDSPKEVLPKSSSRHLLYSWDDDSSGKIRYNYNRDNGEKVIYIIVSTVIFVIVIICRCAMKYGCGDGEETANYSETIVHTPPRTAGTVVPPPSNFGSGYARTSGILNPPRSSRSIILPHEGEIFSTHLIGIENPSYQPANAPALEQYTSIMPIPVSTQSHSQTPLCDLLDMPPSYDTVVKEDSKYPKYSEKS